MTEVVLAVTFLSTQTKQERQTPILNLHCFVAISKHQEGYGSKSRVKLRMRLAVNTDKLPATPAAKPTPKRDVLYSFESFF